jgi:phosphoglycolate phosphatase-like HAD superfamily hydrolase
MIEWDKTKKNIVFDLDGVILDNRRRHSVVLSDSINRINGTKTSADDYDDFVSYKSAGRSGIQYLIEKEISNAEKIMADWVRKIEYKKYLRLDVLYPDALRGLEILSEKCNLFLITARSNRQNTCWQLSQLNIFNYLCKAIVVKNKGNAGLNKYNALSSLSVFAVIGDTEVDFALSEYAQCRFYPLNNGFRSMEYWNQRKQKSYQSIMDIIHSINDLL